MKLREKPKEYFLKVYTESEKFKTLETSVLFLGEIAITAPLGLSFE